jgi:hypothetical protein
MLARVLSAAVNGIEAFPVEVEVNCGWGDTMMIIVGYITPEPTKYQNSKAYDCVRLRFTI